MILNILSCTIVLNSTTVHCMNQISSELNFSRQYSMTIEFALQSIGMRVDYVHIQQIIDQVWKITYSFIPMKSHTSKLTLIYSPRLTRVLYSDKLFKNKHKYPAPLIFSADIRLIRSDETTSIYM